ncbi:MAG: phage DNA encapsidation protein [Methanobrevibacter sp.]|nr:phage DNA encapsidation protein [Methanobrevibacter sp.]
MTMAENIYYNFDKLFSYDFLIAFVIGERGCGKSFNSKLAVLKRFIKTGEQFLYIRRYKTELDTALVTFWDDLQAHGYFDDLELKVKRSKMLTEFTCDRETCGYAVPLSTANILKSTSFPNVTTIIFDEFLLDNSGTYRYLKNEVTMLLDVIETVGRLRDNLKVILLGNALNVHASPYFAYWNLELPYNSEFRTFYDGTIVVNYIKNIAYREAKKKSKFGKLIDGTEYGKYAIDNQVFRENNNFIEKRPPDSTFYGMLIINGTNIGLWNGRNGYLYMSEKYDPNTTMKFVLNYNDHTEQTIFTNVRENYYMHMCVRGYKQGWLRFENQKIKSVATAVLNKCISF